MPPSFWMSMKRTPLLLCLLSLAGSSLASPDSKTTPSAPVLASNLTDIVPSCAWSCLAYQLAKQYVYACDGRLNDIGCLCGQYSSLGYTLGELSYICINQECQGAAPQSMARAYLLCKSIAGSASPTHTILTVIATAAPTSMSTATSSQTGVSYSASDVSAPLLTTTMISQIPDVGNNPSQDNGPSTTWGSTLTTVPSSPTWPMANTTLSSPTPSSIRTPADATQSSNSLTTAQTVGISVGAASCLLIAALSIYCCLWLRRRKRENQLRKRFNATSEGIFGQQSSSSSPPQSSDSQGLLQPSLGRLRPFKLGATEARDFGSTSRPGSAVDLNRTSTSARPTSFLGIGRAAMSSRQTRDSRGLSSSPRFQDFFKIPPLYNRSQESLRRTSQLLPERPMRPEPRVLSPDVTVRSKALPPPPVEKTARFLAEHTPAPLVGPDRWSSTVGFPHTSPPDGSDVEKSEKQLEVDMSRALHHVKQPSLRLKIPVQPSAPPIALSAPLTDTRHQRHQHHQRENTRLQVPRVSRPNFSRLSGYTSDGTFYESDDKETLPRCAASTTRSMPSAQDPRYAQALSNPFDRGSIIKPTNMHVEATQSSLVPIKEDKALSVRAQDHIKSEALKSADSDTSFESVGEDEPSPPEQNTQALNVVVEPGSLSQLRYPKVPRSAGQVVPRSTLSNEPSSAPSRLVQPTLPSTTYGQKVSSGRGNDLFSSLRPAGQTSVTPTQEHGTARVNQRMTKAPTKSHTVSETDPFRTPSQSLSDWPRSSRRVDRQTDSPLKGYGQNRIADRHAMSASRARFVDTDSEAEYDPPSLRKSATWTPMLTPQRRGNDLFLSIS